MEDLQLIIVNERIDDLRRDAEASRMRDAHDDDDRAGATPGGVGAARVRLGVWLIGIGTAVAGSAGDRRGGRAGSAL
jgi:hypothetical protein